MLKIYFILMAAMLSLQSARGESALDWFQFHLEALKKDLKTVEKYKHASEPDEIQKLEDALTHLRTPAFSLEILLEFFEGKYPELKGYRDHIKTIEDAVGYHNDIKDRIKTLTTRAQTLRVERSDPRFLVQSIATLQIQLSQNRRDLIKTLERLDCFKSLMGEKDGKRLPTLVKRFEETLETIHWDSLKVERDFLIEQVIHFIQDKLNTPGDIDDPKNAKYDLQDLNGPSGLHKRRRTDRKLLLLMSAAFGMFVLSVEPLPGFEEILEDPIVNGDYSKLPPYYKKNRHIFIAYALFLEINKSVKEFGRAKDFAEAMEEWLPELLYDEGRGEIKNLEDARKLARKIIKSHPEYEKPLKIATRAYERLLEARDGTGGNPNTVYDSLSEGLKTQIGMSKEEDCRRLLSALHKPKPQPE